jgi:light-regulated signal transduction histidine kinase (bacteriophytochrome)
MITHADILHGKILIVDDQKVNVMLLEQMLSGAGYDSIATTMDPAQVGELHRKNRYDLILLDLMMPGIDGFQVMDRLKEIESGGYLPVLVITAQPELKLRALKAGAKDFVGKPFDLAEILARVYNMLEVRLLHLEAKRLHERLQDANKELQAFSYSVSHDLRAPLRHVLGFVDLLLKDAGPTLTEPSLRHLNTIAQAAKRMGNLIDDLLAFSRVGRAELKTVDFNLNELILETLGDFNAETSARAIAWKIHPLPRVQADPALLRMVLVNLLSNAVKFTGGRAEAKIEVGSQPGENGEVVIFIRDNGAGFDPQYVSKLFGVFQRLHAQDEFEGTGIGLANVQRIIQRHGGRVWAEGVVDGGATFYFSLPHSTKT